MGISNWVTNTKVFLECGLLTSLSPTSLAPGEDTIPLVCIHSLQISSLPASSPHVLKQSSLLLLPWPPHLLCPGSGPQHSRLGSSFPASHPTLSPVGPPPVFTPQPECSISPGVRWQLSIFLMDGDIHVPIPRKE